MATADATEAETAQGFTVGCILCGHDEDSVTVDLSDVRKFRCGACQGEFAAEDVREHLDQWTKVLAWVELAPAKD